MQLLRPITEDEMITVFLQTEIHSVRFESQLMELLEHDNQDRAILERPNLSDPQENAYRRRLLGDFRGYDRQLELFEGFPDDVAWHRAALTRDELMQVCYIDYSYWNDLSGGTRLPGEAAQMIRSGVTIFDVSNDNFLQMAEDLKSGALFPPLILTALSEFAPLVVLEGHARLTAYALAPEILPAEIEVIVGFSPGFSRWGCYGQF